MKNQKKYLIYNFRRQQETEMDYLVPFLAQMGNPKTLSKNQAVKLQKECLEDLKQRLIEQANLIQERFDQETLKLQEKQQEYQQKQVKFPEKVNSDRYLI